MTTIPTQSNTPKFACESDSAMSYCPQGSIDPNAILAIRQAAGQELVDELLCIFEESVPPTLDSLRTAQNTHNTPLILKTAHKWKGSCRIIGAMRAAALCELLESQASNDDFSKTSELIEALIQESLLAQSELVASRSVSQSKHLP